jgi:hypothetical protein
MNGMTKKKSSYVRCIIMLAEVIQFCMPGHCNSRQPIVKKLLLHKLYNFLGRWNWIFFYMKIDILSAPGVIQIVFSFI